MVCKRRVDSIFYAPGEEIEKPDVICGFRVQDEAKLRLVEDLVEQWIQSSGHLPNNYDRAFVRNFIRGSKCNLEIAKKKLENYFAVKSAFPEYFSNRSPESDDVKQAFENVNIVFLPKLTEKGERICVMSLCHQDASKFDMAQTVKLFHMIYDFLLTSEIPSSGEIIIFDAQNFSSAYAAKFISQAFKNILTNLRTSYAIRLRQVHVVNTPGVVEALIRALRPFIHEKIKDRIVVHKKSESLNEYFDVKLLPKEYGGAQGSLHERKEIWREILRENSDWFQAQENVKLVGEVPKKFENNQLEGSFRKLNID